MQRASHFFSEAQRQQIEQAVHAAEAKTACEIVPVVATASGRYDRPEDIVGLWLAVLAAVAVWLAFPRVSAEPGSWDDGSFYLGLLTLIVAIVAAFFLGAVLASRIGWLRRLFTPRRQMHDEVTAQARQAFFDRRVHHTTDSTGLLIYLSLHEHIAVLLGDQQVVEKLGQPALDDLCRQLTQALHQGDPTTALCQTITEAGTRLAAVLPREPGDVNQLKDTLVLMD